MTGYTGGGGALAATGTATIAGIAFDQLWLIAAALVIVGVAAVALRFGFRPNLGVSQVGTRDIKRGIHKR